MKRIISINLILITIFGLLIPPPVQANPALVAAGGVEIGALALWGGAALVAATGVAVGMDKELMAEVEAWGENAYNSAHDAIKSSISTSTVLMAAGWDTANRYAVTWSDATLDYLKDSWDKWFGGKTDIGVIGGAGVQITDDVIKNFTNFNAYIVPSRVMRPTQDSLSNIGVYGTHSAREIRVNEFGQATIYFDTGTYAAYRNKSKSPGVGFANAMEAWLLLVANDTVSWIFNGYSVAPVFEDLNTVNPAGQYVPISFPQTFPRTVVLPAPGGVLDADGNVVQRRVPTIGTVGGVQGGEIAVGYPTIAGDFGALTQADAITGDVVVPGNPPVDYNPPNDSSKLNFAPLLLAGQLLTNKFPFSIPWDLKRQLNVFDIEPQAPVINVNAPNFVNISGESMALAFTIDLTQFNTIATIIRWFTTLLVDIGFMLMLRRLMPE